MEYSYHMYTSAGHLLNNYQFLKKVFPMISRNYPKNRDIIVSYKASMNGDRRNICIQKHKKLNTIVLAIFIDFLVDFPPTAK